MSSAASKDEDRRFPPGSGLLLSVLILAELTISSDFAIASVALPSIERQLKLLPALSQWVITADILAYAGMLIAAGRLADLYGQRRTLTWGLTMFLIGTVLASLSTGITSLLPARILQGIGGAFGYSSAFSLLTISFKDGPQRFRAYTLNMACMSAGVPLVSLFVGWVVTRFGWQSAFLFNVPMCIIVLAGLRLLKLPAHVRPLTHTRIPFASALLLTVGVAALIYALTGFVAHQLGAVQRSTVALIAGLLILVIFAWTERWSRSPLLPPKLFTLQNFLAGIVCVAFVVLTGKAIILLSNVSLQRGLGFTPFKASLTLLPMIISSLLVIPISASLDRILLPYAKWVNVGAFAIIGLFYLLLSVTDASWAYPMLAAILFLSPFLTLTNVNLALNATLRNVPREAQGVATAITYTMVQVVTATGVAIVMTVAGRTGSQAHGFGMFSASFLIAAGFCVVGLLIAALCLRTPEPSAR